jgi:hypothetical protein
MRTNLKPITILPLAVMFIATALARSVQAPPQTFKIHGSFAASEVHVHSNATVAFHVDAAGESAILGHYSLHEDTTLISASMAVGTAEIVTASGDHIYTTTNNEGAYVGPNALAIRETHTVTGGTGRFAGATGTITIERVLDLVTLLSEGTITGTLLLP